MKVIHGPQDPNEKEDYTIYWFIFSALLFVGAIWAIFDESIMRRPWKAYQKAFNKMEMQQLQESRNAEITAIQEQHGDALKALDEKIAASEKKLKSSSYKDLKKEVSNLEKNFKRAEEQQAFAKADLDEAYYLYDHAKVLGKSDAKVQGMLTLAQDLDKTVAERQVVTTKAEKEFLALEAKLKALEKEIQMPMAEREKIYEKVEQLDQRISKVQSRVIQVQQVVVDGLGDFGRVDRCVTCHNGINRSGFEDAAQPHTTHPRREEIFGSHPPEQFGCTGCHHGQGRALGSVFKAHAYEVEEHDGKEEIHYLHHWLEPMYRGKYMEASCNDCHVGQYRIPGAKTWNYGNKLFVELGCHGCHLVEGYQELAKAGPSLRRIETKATPEWMVAWIQNPKKYNPNTRMPNFRLSEKESEAITAYLLQNSEKDYQFAFGYPGAGSVAQGKALVDSIGCRGCHIVGDGRDKITQYRTENGATPPVRDHGPQLTAIAEKVGPQWLYNWLRKPRDYNPHARMPSLRLNDAQARGITSYLMSLTNPMPVDEELRARLQEPEVVAKGEELIRKRGCFGCHDISGYEKADRIGPELSNFGNKDLNEMFFGNTLDQNADFKVEQKWEDWTRNKLKKPVVYDTERIKHLMPNFNLKDDEIETLLVFLKSQNNIQAKAPWRYEMNFKRKAVNDGQVLVDHYNCNACHIVENFGGTIRATIEEDYMYPPNLLGEGKKVQPQWLFSFLHQPVTVRPWLKVKMPSFQLSDKEFTSLVRYFEALDDVDEPYVDLRSRTVAKSSVQNGQHIFRQNACLSCHVLGSIPANLSKSKLASLAPNLLLAKKRLRPEWISDWLADPNALMPGTRMPAFWDVTTTGGLEELQYLAEDLANASDADEKADIQAEIDEKHREIEAARRQIDHVRDYVISIKR